MEVRQHLVSLKLKHIKIQVIAGVFYNEQTDVVVNSTSQRLQLQDGQGSKALLTAAGKQIQTEASAKYPDGVPCGELAITGGHALYCSLVYHCFLKRWSESDKSAEETLKQVITAALREANEADYVTSITFPALGRGYNKFPAKLVAQLMFQCVADFEHSIGTQPKVTDVRFVVYPGDDEAIEAFIEEAKQRSQSVVASMEYMVDIGPVSLTLLQGSLSKHVCDVVVHETTENLDLTKSPVSQELCCAAGPNLEKSLRTSAQGRMDYGQLVVTGNANLTNCKAVYHGALPPYSGSNETDCRKAVNIFLMQCLMEADSTGFLSLSIPPLGVDLKSYPPKLTAESIQASIIEYLGGNSDTSVLRDIYFVISPSNKTAFQGFKNVMFPYTRGKERFNQTLIGKQENPAMVPLNLAQLPPKEPPRGSRQWLTQMYQSPITTPSYWTYFPGGQRLQKLKIDPAFASKGTFKLVDVDPKISQAIRVVVEKTWDKDSFSFGRDAVGLGDLNYNKIKVIEVKRLENLTLYEKYGSFRQQLFGKVLVESKKFRLPEEIGMSKGPLLTTKNIDPCLTKDIYKEINEHYVFHGTKQENMEIIMATGLDSRMAGQHAMFGQGVYAAESSTKADQYTDYKDRRDMTPKFMFLTRMCMGDICVINEPLQMRRPPCKSCLSTICQKSCQNTKLFDSVLVDGKWLFREMIVYDHAQCYPEYLIKYQRVK